ncbi:hypothetical protein GCM10023189_51010 [Nibrella saemangeumensis]|uniref:Uncharacterized protein n=1 Tax=Nibrella saemangeumensis TaxID=1084526 RepID=A0ABP8NI39_9BACT
MARKINIRLTGKAELFVRRMEQEGYDEAGVIAMALGILEEVVETKRVAKIVKGTEKSKRPLIEYFYTLSDEEEVPLLDEEYEEDEAPESGLSLAS